jgi:hypothetical protein
MVESNDVTRGPGWLRIVPHVPALALSVAALALSLGGVAYASAGSPAPRVVHPATSVVLHKIPLLNGWKSVQSAFTSGDPSAGVLNGVVYLSGSLTQPVAGSQIFATLPAGYRPAHNMWMTVYTFGDTSGTLYIGKNGTMQAFSGTSCSALNTAQCYTSLAGVSYPKNS